MLVCKICGVTREEADFPNSARGRRNCRLCLKARCARSRGSHTENIAGRLFYNLTSSMRRRRDTNVMFWTREHVRALVDEWKPSAQVEAAVASGFTPRYRVRRINDMGPWLPNNCVVRTYGE